MTLEQLNALAPGMPTDLQRWFLESDFGVPSYENQDWDLALAQWEHVPVLAAYAGDASHRLEKRYDAFSALMVLHGFQRDPDRGDAQQRNALGNHLRRIVQTQPDFARSVAADWLGITDAVIVLQILGDPIPTDLPQSERDEVERRALNV